MKNTQRKTPLAADDEARTKRLAPLRRTPVSRAKNPDWSTKALLMIVDLEAIEAGKVARTVKFLNQSKLDDLDTLIRDWSSGPGPRR
jgi:hypothetical protein